MQQLQSEFLNDEKNRCKAVLFVCNFKYGLYIICPAYIAYHPEPNLNNGNRTENILHVHEYPQQDNFRVRPAHRITKQEYEKYKKFFKGVPKIEKW